LLSVNYLSIGRCKKNGCLKNLSDSQMSIYDYKSILYRTCASVIVQLSDQEKVIEIFK